MKTSVPMSTPATRDRAADYADLARWPYELAKEIPQQISPLPRGWQIVGKPTYLKESEFGVVILRNDVTKEIVVSYRGTEQTVRDWTTNAELAIPGWKPRELEMAEREMEQALANAPEGYKVRATGHSQGGMLAHYVAKKYDVSSVGFNSAPGNDYLNHIYDTKLENRQATHIDLRASVDGNKTSLGSVLPDGQFDSDIVSGLGDVAHLKPIDGVEAMYLPTGCKDSLCHSMDNFTEETLATVSQKFQAPVLPDEALPAGNPPLMCFETRKPWDETVDRVQDSVEAQIDQAGEAVKEELAGAIRSGGEQLADNIAGAGETMADQIVAAGQETGDLLNRAGEAVGGVVAEKAQQGAERIAEGAAETAEAVKETAEAVAQKTRETAESVADGVEQAAEALKDKAKQGVDAVADAAKDAGDFVQSVYKQRVSEELDEAVKTLGDTYDQVMDLGRLAGLIKDGVGVAVDKIGESASDAQDWLLQRAQDLKKQVEGISIADDTPPPPAPAPPSVAPAVEGGARTLTALAAQADEWLGGLGEAQQRAISAAKRAAAAVHRARNARAYALAALGKFGR